MNPPLPSSATAKIPKPSLKARSVAWLRKTHGWIGLWGATLGLLFGVSGIWLNHRAVLQLPVDQVRGNSQLALPGPPPANAQALAAWLQSALKLGAPTNVRVEPAKPVAWMERPGSEHAGRRHDGERRELAPAALAASDPQPLVQPEHWMVNFGGPRELVQAEYWAGNRSVSVRRTASGVLGTLMNLHKGVGMSIAWILLADTLAGCMILLSLSGLALWILTRRQRVVGLAIFGTALAVTAGLAVAAL